MTKAISFCLVLVAPSCSCLRLDYHPHQADVEANQPHRSSKPVDNFGLSHRSRKPADDFGPRARNVQWGLLIDGKDATAGNHAYEGFDEALASLDFVLHETGDDDLTWELLTDIHRRCCSMYGFRSYENQPLDRSACYCFNQLADKDKDDAIQDIPKDFISFHTQFNGVDGSCPLPRKMHPKQIHAILSQILEQYNRDAKMIPRQDTKQQISVLANFLRKLSWLHPYHDGNGRFRTLLLQRELRHRDVARGAFMYNNNRDIFFISNDTYVEKIEEGIKMASVALETNSNPWANQSYVEAHFKKFPQKCEMFARSYKWGSVDLDKSDISDN